MKPFTSVSGKSKTDIITLDGGLNTCMDKSFIQDNQMPFMWNVTTANAPTLTTRSNRMSIAWYLESTIGYGSKSILAIYSSSEKILYTIEEIAGDTDYGYVYRYKAISNHMARSYIGKVEYSTKYSITECEDANHVYIVISARTKRYMFYEQSQVVIDECQDNNVGILCCHKNRLWVANGSSLKFTKLREYDDFTITQDDEASAGEIQITSGHGKITALASYDNKLIVFCERSWHIIYGDSPYSEVNQFSLVDMDDGIGCISNKTHTICDRELYWMDRDMSVYRYNGSYVYKISEPYSTTTATQRGGIGKIGIISTSFDNFVMSSYGTFVYLAVCLKLPTLETQGRNDTLLVYDTRNKCWWAEDGGFSFLARWEADTNTMFYYKTDYLVGTSYNGDILLLNCYQNTGEDIVFNFETRDFDSINIDYKFETKTWNLGQIKHKKTLTNVWFQADANADVAVCDYWSEHRTWDSDIDDYLIIGKLEKVHIRHNMKNPNYYSHEGRERQRCIVPRMYMQKINAFSIRVEGKGQGYFHMLEKEWRIR